MSSAGETIELLREVGERIPRPSRAWHAHVDLIDLCGSDFRRALDVCARHPNAVALIERAVEGQLEDSFSAEKAGPTLREAYERLRALPLPQGEHPYLDAIVPAVEAMKATLSALSRDPSAAAEFG